MITRPFISIILIILPILTIVVIEYVGRKYNIASEITRKLVHATLGLAAVLGFMEGPIWLYALTVAILAFFIAISFFKKLLSSIHNVNRHTYGELFLPIGILAPLLLVSETPNIYIASILVMAFADSSAGMFGFFLGKKNKSILGSLVFFAVAILVIFLNTNSPIYLVIAVALGSTVVERFSPYGSDNLTVPLATTSLMLFLNM